VTAVKPTREVLEEVVRGLCYSERRVSAVDEEHPPQTVNQNRRFHWPIALGASGLFQASWYYLLQQQKHNSQAFILTAMSKPLAQSI
jgi:hypothetical protein